MPAPHPPEFRRLAVDLARQKTAPVAQIAKDLGISESCLRNWMARADVDEGRKEGLTSDERKELVALRRDRRRLGALREPYRAGGEALIRATIQADDLRQNVRLGGGVGRPMTIPVVFSWFPPIQPRPPPRLWRRSPSAGEGPVRGVASQGTVNALVRIGDKFLARFPELVSRLAELGVPAPKVSVTAAGVIERQSIGKLRGFVPLLSAARG